LTPKIADVTGSSKATVALVVIYDALGFSPLNLQGADILSAPDSRHPFKVYIPDILQGNLADPSWYPPRTLDHEHIASQHFGPEGPVKASRVTAHVRHLRDVLYRRFRAFAIMGHGWGANVALLSSFQNSPFNAMVLANPSQLEPLDGSRVTIPGRVLTTKGIDHELVHAFENDLSVPKVIKTYRGANLGLASSRNDLESPGALEDYKKNYSTIFNFLHNQL
jgi:dienelactone hydrolase